MCSLFFLMGPRELFDEKLSGILCVEVFLRILSFCKGSPERPTLGMVNCQASGGDMGQENQSLSGSMRASALVPRAFRGQS